MRKNTSLREQLEAFKSGSFMDADGKVDTGCYNFYDWFCKDSSLERRARTLFGKLKTFINHNPQVDLDKHYVFFKNNCPMVGNLYDSFSICDRETGNVIYWVAPNHRGKAEIYSLETGFERPLKEADTFKALFAAA